MRLPLLLLSAAVLAGCGTQYKGFVSTGAPVLAGEGTTIVAGPAGLYASVSITGTAGEVLYWMTGLGIYGAMLMDDYRYGGPFLPPMKADRTVAEIDCTKPPPADLVGNIKCK
jgi:hypothetical protein